MRKFLKIEVRKRSDMDQAMKLLFAKPSQISFIKKKKKQARLHSGTGTKSLFKYMISFRNKLSL